MNQKMKSILPKKVLSPKLDIVFQAIFGEVGNEAITKKFLQSILQTKISEIELNVNPILRRQYQNDKLGILDILAKINEIENCNIEVQVIEQKSIIERILYYWSKLYIRELKKR